jgi:alpha-1,2-mannosyltransferase
VGNVLRTRLLSIVCIGLIADLIVQPIRALRDLPATDFVNFVAAARILRSGSCLYCSAAQEAASHAVVGGPLTSHFVVFVSPPLVAAVFSPLSPMDPHVALAIFLGLSLAAIGLAAWLIATRWLPNLSILQRAVFVTAAVASAPAMWGIAIGQLDPLLFCAVVAGMTIWRRHPILAGMLIGVLCIKPQLFVLVPVALILSRNWRMMLGTGIAMAGLALTTLTLMGWNHLLDWPHFVLSQYATVPAQSISVPLTIGRFVGSGALTGILALTLCALGVGVLWRRRDHLSDVGTAVALGITLTMLASPHLLAYDTLFLTIPLAWMARTDWGRATALALALSPAYLIDALVAPAASLGAGATATSVIEPLLLIVIVAAVVGHHGRRGIEQVRSDAHSTGSCVRPERHALRRRREQHRVSQSTVPS